MYIKGITKKLVLVISIIIFCKGCSKYPNKRSIKDFSLQKIEGRSIYYLKEHSNDKRLKQILDILPRTFQLIDETIPKSKIDFTKKIKYFIETDISQIESAGAITYVAWYNNDHSWLYKNNFIPEKADNICLNSKTFYGFDGAKYRWMGTIIHEISHALHFQKIGVDSPDIIKAFENSKDKQNYENHKEYFAESCAQVFQRLAGDKGAWDMKVRDPEVYKLVVKYWLENKHSINKRSIKDFSLQKIEGRSIYYLKEHSSDKRLNQILDILPRTFQLIDQTIPKSKIDFTKQIKYFIETDISQIESAGAITYIAWYNNDHSWLYRNNFIPEKADNISLNSKTFYGFDGAKYRWMGTIIHEISHALHFQKIGVDSPDIIKAFENSKDKQNYENHKEYFAESCAQVFQRLAGDKGAWDMKVRDPEVYKLVVKYWLENKHSINKRSIKDFSLQKIEGRSIYYLKEHSKDKRLKQILDILPRTFKLIDETIPKSKIDFTKKIKYFIETDAIQVGNAGVITYIAWYNSDHSWLDKHGFIPEKADNISLNSKTIYGFDGAKYRWMGTIIHEISHALHFQKIGVDSPDIIKAFENSKNKKYYQYNFENHKEYFAELCAQVFQRLAGDKGAWDIKVKDPEGYRLVDKYWLK